MRTERIADSDAALDKAENEWWNKNATIIEKIWAQNKAVQEIIRLPYLTRMKSFFLKDSAKLPLTILEVGCGTGWVCRLVADKDFHVIGTDFSEEQIRIATENAKLFNKEAYCTYKLADASSFEKNIDGVVIHGILHHLSKKELSVFFNQLSKLSAGTKVFLYEPSFFNPASGKASLRDKIVNRLILLVKRISLHLAKKTGKEDIALAHSMKDIYEDAQKSGWYITPKEVPFYEGEIEGYMNDSFILTNKYIVNRTELDIAQSLTFYSIDEKPSFLFSRILIPVARYLDNLLFKGNFRAFIPAQSHLFVCFEWIKK